jgi:hypothetical protein
MDASAIHTNADLLCLPGPLLAGMAIGLFLASWLAKRDRLKREGKERKIMKQEPNPFFESMILEPPPKPNTELMFIEFNRSKAAP